MGCNVKKYLVFAVFIIALLALTGCNRSDNDKFRYIEKYETLFNDSRYEYEYVVDSIKKQNERYSLFDHIERGEYLDYSQLKDFDRKYDITFDSDVCDIIFDKNLIQFEIDAFLDDFNGYYYSIDGNAYDPIGYSIRDIKEDKFFQYSDRILTKGKDFSTTTTKQKWKIVINENLEEFSQSKSWYYLYRIDEHWFYYHIIVEF